MATPWNYRRLLRPEDLVVLEVAWQGMLVNDDVARNHARGEARFAVRFPPQHLHEQAFFERVDGIPVSDPPSLGREGDPVVERPPDPDKTAADSETLERPVLVRAAGPSRLVFRVPPGGAIELTVAGVLDAMRRLRLVVAPLAESIAPPFELPRVHVEVDIDRRGRVGRVLFSRVRGPLGGGRVLARGGGRWPIVHEGKVPPIVAAPAPLDLSPPRDGETSLEIPYRLLMSPDDHGAWGHRVAATGSPAGAPGPLPDGPTELWHTTLGRWEPAGDDEVVTRFDPATARPLRALWTRDDPSPTTPADPDATVDLPGHGSDVPGFRASLDSYDRHNIVHLTSNRRLRAPGGAAYVPEPFHVDRLLLSALGGWLDGQGAWPFPQPRGLTLEAWRHLATLGRDHHVRVVHAGRLMPFGHRASLVKVTERKPHGAGGPAWLRQRMYVVVREPTRLYREGLFPPGSGLKPHLLTKAIDGSPDRERQDLKFPFVAVAITTVTSPDIDPPPPDSPEAFWPSVDSEPVQFGCEAIDPVGNVVTFTLPMRFVSKQVLDAQDRSKVQVEAGDYKGGGGWTVAKLGGQAVAYADSVAADGVGRVPTPDEVSLPTDELAFGVFVPPATAPPPHITYPGLDWWALRFFPVVLSATVDVAGVSALAGRPTRMRVRPARAHLVHGWGPANRGEVFLEADESAARPTARFSDHADRSGALATPDVQVVGLSRRVGPVSGTSASLAAAARGEFEPTDWFAGLDGAKLLGFLPLETLVPKATLDAAPRLVGGATTVLDDAASLATTIGLDDEFATMRDTGVDGVPTFAAAVEAMLGTVGPVEAASAQDLLDHVPAITDALAAAAAGEPLAEAPGGHLRWRTALAPHQSGMFRFDPTTGPFPHLAVSVEAHAGTDGQPRTRTTSRLGPFTLELTVLRLHFEHLAFRVDGSRKPEVDAQLDPESGVEFIRALRYVHTLAAHIDRAGFSDPPAVDVDASGITASYSLGIPQVAVGVFSLQQVELSAGLSIPFAGPPMHAWFHFCRRDAPALLTVGMFGGGAYVGVSVTAGGLRAIEAALEFGAAAALNFGVAAGVVSAMGGVLFALLDDGTVELTGYFRVRGTVRALGIVSVSIELYLGLAPKPSADDPSRLEGSAHIWVEVDLGLVSKDIRIEAKKSLAGADPPFADMVSEDEWDDYWQAFAA